MATPSRVEWPGLNRLVKQLRAVPNVDCTPLMGAWGSILVEGNRRGVLSGLDGNDQRMPPLKYRGGAGKKTANRRLPLYGTSRYQSTGRGPFAAGLNDNLTSSEYRRLTGPRLAPRGEASRVIKNLHAEIRHPSPTRWEAVAAWLGVVSNRGVPFLPFHFGGRGRNPKYDLRPVRPRDRQFCLNQLKAFAKAVFFNRF